MLLLYKNTTQDKVKTLRLRMHENKKVHNGMCTWTVLAVSLRSKKTKNKKKNVVELKCIYFYIFFIYKMKWKKSFLFLFFFTFDDFQSLTTFPYTTCVRHSNSIYSIVIISDVPNTQDRFTAIYHASHIFWISGINILAAFHPIHFIIFWKTSNCCFKFYKFIEKYRRYFV